MRKLQILRRAAMRRAMELRRSLGIPRESPVNAFDICKAVGMELRFMDLPSLEGMFSRDPHPIVILPSFKHRPKGRILFSCGHEVGHYQLGHEPTVDQFIDPAGQPLQKSDNEIQADAFASSLLMTRQSVLTSFSRMSLDLENASVTGFYKVSRQLGVGYTSLLMHCRYGLELISDSRLSDLKKISPKKIRQQFLDEQSVGSDLVFVDHSWPDVPVELEVGDFVLIPPETELVPSALQCVQVVSVDGSWKRIQATSQGEFKMEIEGNRVSARIAGQDYCGLFEFRYMEDPDAE